MQNVDRIYSGLSLWLDRLNSGCAPGRYRFCAEGDMVPVDGQQGLLSTCMVMKIAWQTKIWDTWPQEKKKSCIEFVKSFQREDGRFVDPWLMSNSHVHWKEWASVVLRRSSLKALLNKKEMNVRAETRQSAAILLMVGDRPSYPLPVEICSPYDVKKYMQSLDWINPWSGGSHLSHQMMMLTVNHDCWNSVRQYDEIIDEMLFCLGQLQDAQTGTWYNGQPADRIKINGAMKVFAGLQWLDRSYPHCTNLLDFALAQPFEKDGCGFLNRLFVVQQCLRGVPAGWRKAEVEELAYRALIAVEQFAKDDGAFSFYQDRAQDMYYGAQVSEGRPLSDLHGTFMMTWAIAIIESILSYYYPDDSTLLRLHRA